MIPLLSHVKNWGDDYAMLCEKTPRTAGLLDKHSHPLVPGDLEILCESKVKI